MAISKKGLRTLKLDDETFFWKTSGDKNHIKLIVIPVNTNCQFLTAKFEYFPISEKHDQRQPIKEKKNQRIQITPGIVKKVMNFGKRYSEWQPNKKGQNVDLGILNGSIELIYDQEIIKEVCIDVNESVELRDWNKWLILNKSQISLLDNGGCGCCVLLYKVIGKKCILDTMPEKFVLGN